VMPGRTDGFHRRGPKMAKVVKPGHGADNCPHENRFESTVRSEGRR